MNPVDEVANKSFHIPTHYVVAGYLLMVVVLAIGTWLSIRLDDWTWLARFGAFLVCLAMMFQVTGALDRYINKVIGLVDGVTAEVVLMQVKRLPHLYGICSETKAQQIQEISEKEHRRRLTHAADVIRSSISRKVQRHEFFVASVGTLLWAFADLLNKL
ncbi:hypothetical protein PFAS1_23470 [Pseudomonas frederiksbergensis]|uniref:hypothetical protein n=1 Tax=Pseudomonas frederiksbergensis TaxID=104087 RepID=UPI000957E1C2|nr:hypothetical protein [Pseudomonas frederiksbergensis]APV42138.1 hypothetical protein PFAS1_23470 [Pseudomonas frederiksbergensis]